MLTGGFKTSDGFKPSSRIVMGTFPLASAVPYDTSVKLLDKYFELGGRTIDTARSYNGEFKNGDSKSEWLIGKWIKQNNIRDEITLITNIRRCELVQEICKELGVSPAALCVAYIANNDVDGYAVIGNSKLEQLEDTMTASDLVLDKELIRKIDSLRTIPA